MSTMTPTTERGRPATDDSIDAQAMLGALDDACRAVLEATREECLTATELAEQCEIPMSTAYRKVEMTRRESASEIDAGAPSAVADD